MRFRPYIPADFAALYAIEEVCFQAPFRFGSRYMKRLLDAPGAACWIAEDDGGMAGFAIVDWTEQTDGVSAYIETIEVAPAYRRRGVAAELMWCVEVSARAAGAVVIGLHVATDNADAIRLYEEHGYHYEASEEHFYAPGHGAHVYRKSLAAG